MRDSGASGGFDRQLRVDEQLAPLDRGPVHRAPGRKADLLGARSLRLLRTARAQGGFQPVQRGLQRREILGPPVQMHAKHPAVRAGDGAAVTDGDTANHGTDRVGH